MGTGKFKGYALISLAWLLLVVSCHQDQSAALQRTVFRYNESKGIATLDPAFARNQTIIWPVHQLFNGLVQMDDSLHVQPCIAYAWEVDSGGLVYRFYLRRDVYFHDNGCFARGVGRKVNASDFVYSFERIIDRSVASPGAWIFHVINHHPEQGHPGFIATSDSVLEIHLLRTFPAFPGLLTMTYCSVVPHEALEKYGADFRRTPVGTGPFMFKLWREGEKLVFIKNPHYFEKDQAGYQLPYLDAVAITFVSDKQSEFLEFIKGNLDFISGVHSAYKSELLTRAGNLNPKYSSRFQLITGPYLNTEYLGFLMDTTKAVIPKPLRDIRVRKAINYGFDRVKMVTYLRNNLAVAATEGMVPQGLPSYCPQVHGYPYNPDRAAALLAEAGYPQGRGLPAITLTTTSDYLDVCEYLQHELSKIGIRLSLEVSTGAIYRDNVANSKLAFFRGSWIADYPDAENYLALFYSGNFSPSGPNYTHYSRPEFDRLYELSLRELSDSLRFAYYRMMDQMVMDDAVVVPLYYDKVVRFAPKSIQHLDCNPLNLLTLKQVKKQNP